MAVTYSEFDSTPATLVADLKAAILANAAWSAVSKTQLSTTNSVATTTSSANITLNSVGTLQPGNVIVINPGAANETIRTVISLAGNVVTTDANIGVFAIGTSVVTRQNIVKATTARGADMIVDLGGSSMTPGASLGIGVFRSFAGSDYSGFSDLQRYHIWYRATAMATSGVVHCVISVSQEHLYISLEGPRATEPNATSTTFGSLKNYFAVCDVVPYHASDTVPCVAAIGSSTNNSAPSVTNNSHQCAISAGALSASPWHPGRLATLQFPTIYSSDVAPVNRTCSIDGEVYLLPFVVFSEVEGIRGRLSRFFFANTNAPSPATDYPDPVGTRVKFDGVEYRMSAPNKGDGSVASWGPFGSILNTSANPMRSIILAVPRADVV